MCPWERSSEGLLLHDVRIPTRIGRECWNLYIPEPSPGRVAIPSKKIVSYVDRGAGGGRGRGGGA